jgi:hypothetical protein
MGLKVVEPDIELRDLMWGLWNQYARETMHIDAENPAVGKVSLDAWSYADSERGAAVGFVAKEAAGKVVGGQWFGWWDDQPGSSPATASNHQA